jgi:hypothetical protein
MSKRSQDVSFMLKPPDGEKLLVPCTKCTSETKHLVWTSIEERGSEPMGGGNTYDWSADYQIIQCLGCETVSFRKESSNSEDTEPDFETIYTEQLYPSRTNNWRLLDDLYCLPSTLQRIYQETVLALNNDQPVLSGIGIRAIIETVSREEGAKGRSLKHKIDGLVEKGKLTTEGAAILHKIRNLGNGAAHESKAPKANELKLAMKVVEHLIEAVYILPAHARGTFEPRAAAPPPPPVPLMS